MVFWLSARLLEAITFLSFAITYSDKPNPIFKKFSSWIFAGILAYVAATFVLTIYRPGFFPEFVGDQGILTPIKKVSEYSFIAVHILITYLLIKNEDAAGSVTRRKLAEASLVVAVSGLSFSTYVNGNDVIIFMGHLFKAMAYFLIFRVALQKELVEPYFRIMRLHDELAAQSANLARIQSQLFQMDRLSNVGINVSTILHDLNNMLTVTTTSANKILQTLAEHGQLDKLEFYSNSIIKSVAKTQEFQKLLLRQAGQKSEPGPVGVVDTGKSAEALLPLLRNLAGAECSIALVTTPDAMVAIGSSEFEQVLMNLVVNARDALKGKVGEIAITIRKLPATVELIVKDSGRGIPMGIRDKIFTPFFSTKADSAGTGLGLYIVKSIVEKFGGRIEVQSEENLGSEFVVSFPLAVGPKQLQKT